MISLNKYIFTSIFALLCLCLNAQGLSKSDIEIKSSNSPDSGRVVVNYIKNNYSEGIIVRFTNEYGIAGPPINLRAGEQRSIDVTCNIVEAKPQGGGKFIDIIRKPKPKEQVEKQEEPKEQQPVQKEVNKPEPTKVKELTEIKPKPQTKKGSLTIENRKVVKKIKCNDSIQMILTSEPCQQKEDTNQFSEETDSKSTEAFDWKNMDWRFIGIGAGLFFFLIILFVWFRKANKKNRTTTLSNNDFNGATDASSAIVIRRKTTSILRKQSLEDVIDNDAYLKIDCSEFCDDSAVKRIFIKNTCIKEIYNMYAEDLRTPNNPNEDGCMVLGRWVHDAECDEYYVSLEHVVFPGDDAVFAEYELNFGGKIKLKVTEKLKKLRRETNLQYDITCWVHSHPGLGVFFSNSDSNVQQQLKHPTHPNFLTAIVVDILTPQQEMGIFTFKRDSTINSKADLKKIYSLEELYKWAVESDRKMFKIEDYYNTLADAKAHADECSGIELSNGAIIDIGMLVAEQNTGLVGFVHGFSNPQSGKIDNIAEKVTKEEAVPDNELIGCFLIATHCSIPSIRKVISNYFGKIKFVFIYTTTDDLLTSIPVTNLEICTDEKYYGEQKLEDLKIWTRRKR